MSALLMYLHCVYIYERFSEATGFQIERTNTTTVFDSKLKNVRVSFHKTLTAETIIGPSRRKYRAITNTFVTLKNCAHRHKRIFRDSLAIVKQTYYHRTKRQ